MPPDATQPHSAKHYRPFWIARVPAKVFPRGPRALYCYIAAFPTGCCYLFNYRLAQKFHVSIRTIRRWKTWLIAHSLAHIWWETPRRPRIICHHFKSAPQWIMRMAIPNPQKYLKKHPLTNAQKEARRRQLIKQLVPKRRRTTLSP
jgi:hypothetical protein